MSDERKTDADNVVRMDDHRRQLNWIDKFCPPPPKPKLTVRADGPDAATLLADAEPVHAGTGHGVIEFMCSEFSLRPGDIWFIEVPGRGRIYTIRTRTRAELDAGVTAIVDEQPINSDGMVMQ